MKRALFTALIALTSTACITEESEPATTDDAGVQADGSVAPDAASGGCEGPNPSEPACATDDDCGASQICQQVPGCEPSSCECVEGGWLCTEDCGPVMGCVDVGPPGRCPDQFQCGEGEACVDGACVPGNPCGPDNLCPPGEECSEGRCLPLGVPPLECDENNPCPGEGAECVDNRCVPLVAPCARDYDCPNSACDLDTGRCLAPCEGDAPDPNGPVCDAIPPVCPIGTSPVPTGGCYGCEDPRNGCEADPGEACWGAFLTPDGICQGPNDGVMPAECCQLDHYRHHRGVVEPSCAPDDGLATALRFSLGDRACGDQPRADLTLQVWAPQGEVRGEIYDFRPGQGGGMVQLCDLDDCAVALDGQITFDAVSDYELTGRFWVRFGDEVFEASFQAESCGELPDPGCG